MDVNTPIDYSSRYSFGHFCCRVKQGKRLSEFLQNCTDSGTENTHLADYNISVWKYVKISAGLPLLSVGEIRERSSKNQILHNLAMFTSNVLNNKRFKQMKRTGLWKNIILWAISRREISPLVVIFKKNIEQPSWKTTRSNYKHVLQITCISSRFRVLHLLSWEFERSEVLWRYTVILACHLKHVEFGWSTRNYPHTCHLSQTCTLSLWLHFSVKFPSVAPKKTRNGYFSYISEDFHAFWSKNNQKNACKHRESESISRNLSAAVIHVKPSGNNSNLNDIVISLQRADLVSYHFLVTGTKIFRIIWKLSVNC